MEGSMRKVLIGLSVLFAVSLVSAQAKAEGGYIMKSLTGSYSTYSQEQAVNSMADWFSCKRADSTAVGIVLTKYGSTARLKAIYNNSGSVQKVTVIFLNKLNGSTNDTITLNLNAYSSSGKLPAIKQVVSGAVVDSTIYFFQQN